VAWTEAGEHPAMGVLLEQTAELEALLGELETRLSGRRLRGRALLIEAEPSRAALLAEYLWSHGYDIEEVPAPLHAIQRLTQGDVALVAIGPRLSTCSGGEFASFVAEHYPRVHRLVVAHVAHGTGAHTVAAAFEIEEPAVAMSAVVCDDSGGGGRS
jgi:CheY-like chemotaxis protein